MPSIITLTTDFGRDSPYVAAMKGVILSLNPAVKIVDITHGIAPQNIIEGAFVLAQTTPWFPAGSIHVAVVDPGVGSERRIIYARIGEHHYVCPDNGLLSYLCRDRSPDVAYEVTTRSLFLPQVSYTFHGRDIMAPVAARLSLGLEPAQLGPQIERLNLFPCPRPDRQVGGIAGQVLHVDSFGNLITNIERSELPDNTDLAAVTVEYRGATVNGISSTYADASPGQTVALFGSSGLLELAIAQGSAAREFGLGVGDSVHLRW